MRLRKKKPSQILSTSKSTTLNLQTRPFTPVESEESAPIEVQNSSNGNQHHQPENLLQRLIDTQINESRSPADIVQRKKRKHFPKIRSQDKMALMPIQAKLNIGEPNDKYEKEADATAAKVVQQINSSPHGGSVQKQESLESEDEELQMKPAISTIQRQETMEDEDEELQTKSFVQRRENLNGGEASTDLESSIQSARSGGQSLDPNLQAQMGKAMGADFSGVKVHTDAQADQLNKSIQAKAFTTGQDLFFRQGAYEPRSRGGQELIAHELTHVVQQSGSIQRKVNFTFNAKAGTKAKLLHSHDKKFSEIKKAYKEYAKTTDIYEELTTLRQIISDCNGYLEEHKGKNDKKDLDAKNLLEACKKELPEAESSTYIQDLTKGKFKYLTVTGSSVNRGLEYVDEDIEPLAKKFGLTKGELTAIRIYAAGDYRYMNPVVADNDVWLDGAIKVLIEGAKVNMDGKIVPFPPEWRDTDSTKQMLKSLSKGKDPATKDQKEAIKNEAFRHNYMALSGLKKMDKISTTTYRGEGFEKEAFEKRYQVGQTFSYPAFTSTSLDKSRSEDFAQREGVNPKIPILLELTVNNGRDISEISDIKSEKEILLLPKATFKVDSITPPTTLGGNTIVKVTQIS
ncbi:MAG: hypothetical protein DCF19_02785 [Pseudanabaena frigida]|uniref:NAD(+)--protein-arginine ADP-ribosyltransferase n=1 Tax=Pseudanabaena frigida TaxID=945775 RepID=A0A2W4WLS3_9CYAN|nr:MAG: hypothetical protein DCF19_02785 [Pseudanabaena frigida]